MMIVVIVIVYVVALLSRPTVLEHWILLTASGALNGCRKAYGLAGSGWGGWRRWWVRVLGLCHSLVGH